uniref:Uncharacterized protein n=1 Tax=Anguilla anguilla TaxID=7936 RepID=A0A0E9XR83_ANGAN
MQPFSPFQMFDSAALCWIKRILSISLRNNVLMPSAGQTKNVHIVAR